MAEAKTVLKIPVLPISYGDALPLLRNLKGPVAPEDWRGALPITYRIGPGPAKVHLKLTFEWKVRPLYNVIARIDGAVFPDQWIVQGNHHDGWVNGANDPTTGNVALMETARGFAELLKQGWKPKRTIILGSWDGEEWGLLGSTEWGEQHARDLREKGVVYINTDSNGRGWLSASGSHSLEAFVSEVARSVMDPKSGKPDLHRGPRSRGPAGLLRGAEEAADGPAEPRDQRAGIGLRLHRLPRSPDDGLAERGVRGPGSGRWAGPLDLRHHRVVRTILGRGVPLREDAVADRRNAAHAARRRTRAALRVRDVRAHGVGLRR